MPSEPIVHIIDDDAAIRDSLAFLLQSVRIATTAYESAAAFLASISAEQRGCIITDIRMPDMSGIDLLRRVKDMKVEMPVIVITGHGDVPLAVEAMKLGAFDFLEKPFNDEAIISLVQTALNRSRKAEKANADRVDLDRRIVSLSSRERDVLNGLVAGNSNKVIASDLDISPRTVEIYRANVMTKMQAASLSELVRMAIAAGLTEPDSGLYRRYRHT